MSNVVKFPPRGKFAADAERMARVRAALTPLMTALQTILGDAAIVADKAEALAVKAETIKPPVIVRSFSPCGPCLTLGKLTKKTAQFYCYDEWKGGDVYQGARKVRRDDVGGTYSRAHIVPCPSCRDHERTQYPEGYMD